MRRVGWAGLAISPLGRNSVRGTLLHSKAASKPQGFSVQRYRESPGLFSNLESSIQESPVHLTGECPFTPGKQDTARGVGGEYPSQETPAQTPGKGPGIVCVHFPRRSSPSIAGSREIDLPAGRREATASGLSRETQGRPARARPPPTGCQKHLSLPAVTTTNVCKCCLSSRFEPLLWRGIK